MRLYLALVMFAAAVPAAAQAPRAPAGRWVLDFGATQCLASRNYGSETAPLTLALKPSVVGNVIQIAVVLTARKTVRGEPAEIPVRVGIDKRPAIETLLLAMSAKQGQLRTLWINLPYDAVEPLRTAKLLSLRAAAELDESFSLTAMAPLLRQMETCLADLRRVWNVDVAQPLKIRARAKASLASYISNGDYPAAAVSRDHGGVTALALLIDESGAVADCMVTETSQVPMLDAQACALLLTRARFTPAVGTDGKPAKDAVFSRIRWVPDPDS
jgi:TonB family protein